MISLSKKGYERFITGAMTSVDLQVAVLSAGLTNADMYTAKIDVARSDASSAKPTFPFDDYAINWLPVNRRFRLVSQVLIDSLNFADVGDISVSQNAAVIDITDNEFIGTILLYPQSDPISFAALNDAPVNVDYRSTGMAEIIAKSSSTTSKTTKVSPNNDFQTYDDMFYPGLTALPFYDSGKTVNLLNDLKIALFRTSNPGGFVNQIFDAANTCSTLKSLSAISDFQLISAGFEYQNLNFAAHHPTLTALDTTIHIPLCTINETECFCVTYFETNGITDRSARFSDNYTENSFLISTVSQDNNQRLYPFRQSIILNPLDPPSVNGSRGSTLLGGIMAVNNYVGPELWDSSLDSL